LSLGGGFKQLSKNAVGTIKEKTEWKLVPKAREAFGDFTKQEIIVSPRTQNLSSREAFYKESLVINHP
jgi:hypothetical protein